MGGRVLGFELDDHAWYVDLGGAFESALVAMKAQVGDGSQLIAFAQWSGDIAGNQSSDEVGFSAWASLFAMGDAKHRAHPFAWCIGPTAAAAIALSASGIERFFARPVQDRQHRSDGLFGIVGFYFRADSAQVIDGALRSIGDEFAGVENPIGIKPRLDLSADGVEFAELLSQVSAAAQAHGMFAGDDPAKLDDFFKDTVCDSLEFLDVFLGGRVQEGTQLNVALGCMSKQGCRDPLGLEDVLHFDEELGHAFGLDR